MSNVQDLRKMMEEHSPQQVNEIENVRSLSNYVIQLQALEDEVKIMEENLKKKKEAADKISEQVIPEIMEDMKLKTLKLQDGSGIEVKEIYGATIPVDKKEGAYKWLRNNDLWSWRR
jgi:vacuolar-type H+-ATPase subunit D/Vma8